MKENIPRYGLNFLVDTDVVINHIKGFYNIKNDLSNKGNVNISVLSEYEIYNGVTDDKMMQEVEDLLSFFNRINITSDICRTASNLQKKYKNIENTLKLIDLLIASTCIVNKFVLVTKNVKHFKIIPDIEIYGEKHSGKP